MHVFRSLHQKITQQVQETKRSIMLVAACRCCPIGDDPIVLFSLLLDDQERRCWCMCAVIRWISLLDYKWIVIKLLLLGIRIICCCCCCCLLLVQERGSLLQRHTRVGIDQWSKYLYHAAYRHDIVQSISKVTMLIFAAHIKIYKMRAINQVVTPITPFLV